MCEVAVEPEVLAAAAWSATAAGVTDGGATDVSAGEAGVVDVGTVAVRAGTAGQWPGWVGSVETGAVEVDEAARATFSRHSSPPVTRDKGPRVRFPSVPEV